MRAKRRESIDQLDRLIQSTFLEMFGDPVTNPKGWRLSTLGETSQELRNGRSIKQNSDAGGVPISRIETISQGKVNPKKVGYAGLSTDEAESYFLHPGDILFSHINSTSHLCKCAIYLEEHGPLVHGMNLLRIRPGKDLNPWFLLHLLKTDRYRASMMVYENPAVNQSSIAASKLKAHPMPVPPLAVQLVYAEAVESIENQRRRLSRHAGELDLLFASLQSQAFSGAL